MAINIGPRIGVDGEAQYRAQLQNIIQATKTLKAEMEQTESSFGKNASAMDKAKAKAENLTKQIELQRQRVDQLKDMVQKSAEKYGEADTRTLKWKEAIAQAQTELGRMETELGDLTPKVKTLSETLVDAGNKLKAIGGKISDAGETWTKYISAPIAKTGSASIAAFKEVDKGTDTLIAKTGATGAALDKMKGSMEELATTIPTDFETAGAAVGEVNTRFGLTGKRLETLSGQFIKFAKLNGTDVSGSIDKVQSSMAAWNMDADKAGTVLDMLNKAGQDTGINVDKLAGSLQTNSTALKEMGFDMESSISLLANLEKNGVDSSTAVTGLRKALQNAIKQGKPLDEALSDLQTTMGNASNDTDAMAAAVDLFGSKAGPQLAAAISEGRISFEKTENTLSGFTDSVEDTFSKTVDGTDEFTMALNEAKATGAEVGKTLLTMAVPAIRKVGEIVKGAKEAWNGLSQSQQETIVKIAGIVAAVGPALVVIGKIASAVGDIMSLAPQITAAIGTASAFVSSTLIPALSSAAAAFAPFLVPAGLIIAGIVAATVLIVKNWDNIKKGAAKLKEGVAKAWEWFKVQLPKIVNLILPGPMLIINNWDKLKAAAGVLKTNVVNAWSNLKTGVVDKAKALKSDAEGKLNELKTGAVNIANNIKEGVVGKFTALKDSAVDKVKSLKSKAVEVFSGAKDKLKSIADSIKDGVVGKFESLKDGVVGKINSLREKLSGTMDKIKHLFNVTLKPKLKLPHVKIEGKLSLNPPSTPKISVEWYKKAYNNPLMFSTPTIVGGRGFGDGAGGEIVIGKDTMLAWIRDAVNGGGSTTNNSTSYGDINVVVNAAPGQNVRELADLVADRIQQQVSMRRRAT